MSGEGRAEIPGRELRDLPTARGTGEPGLLLYVQALGGQPRPGANRLLAEQIDKLPTPLAKAQLGAALALAQRPPAGRGGVRGRARCTGRQGGDLDRGSARRDQVATALLLKESGLLATGSRRCSPALPGADLKPEALSTQEEAWAAAAGAVLGRDGARAHRGQRQLPSRPRRWCRWR